ncbi:MAG: hypothetical protein ACT4QG_17110 [Sporichthyaceae bacterium]
MTARHWMPIVLVGALAFATATPALGRTPAATTPAGFVPGAEPVRVRAPDVRILDLAAIVENSPIDLAGGGRSPSGSATANGTVFLRFAGIELDRLSLRQNHAGAALTILESSTAGIGGAGGTVELWGVLRSLRVCLPVGVLPTGGGSCTDVRPLFSVLAALIRQGAKLPREIRGEDLDIDVYALRAKAKPGEFGLRLPTGRVTVTAR